MHTERALRGGLLIVAVALCLPSAASADPIQDLTMDTYETGWFPNYYRGRGPLTCPRACEAWTGARAEGERASDLVEDARHSYVCKVTDNPKLIFEAINDPTSHWIYGSQYDDLPVCYATQKFGGAWLSREYMCLCVDDCQKPDLVVSKIERPTWDGAQSVIDVQISNVGGAAAGPSVAELRDYEHPPGVATAPVPAIAAGGSVTVTFTLPYWVYDPNASLIATADVKQEVDECREDNNRLRFFEPG